MWPTRGRDSIIVYQSDISFGREHRVRGKSEPGSARVQKGILRRLVSEFLILFLWIRGNKTQDTLFHEIKREMRGRFRRCAKRIINSSQPYLSFIYRSLIIQFLFHSQIWLLWVWPNHNSVVLSQRTQEIFSVSCNRITWPLEMNLNSWI